MAGPGLSYVGKEEERLVIDALRSQELSRYRFDAAEQKQSKVYRFEQEFARQINVTHCLGMNSCTSALLAGLLALGLRDGDEVIVPGYTFIASIAAIVYAGGIPVLAEVDDSLTLDPDDVRRKITTRTRAVLCVHMLGASCDMSGLKSICDEFGLVLLEDVAQACGASYQGRPLGSIGRFGAFSLNIFKTITAGDGGVLTTNDTGLFERAFAFHDHGSKPYRQGVLDGSGVLGLNLRMHELTGAVALAQCRKLQRILTQCRKQKRTFLNALGQIACARRRQIHDPEGECGTLIVLLFDTCQQACTAAAALQTKTLLETGKHHYGHMPQLLGKRTIHASGWPFVSGGKANTTMEYSFGMLPRTDEILGRAVALCVGVRDAYLGAAYGIDVHDADQVICQRADEFHWRVRSAGLER